MLFLRFFTANKSASLLSAGFIANAADAQRVPSDGWMLIAPLGNFPSPDGSYSQAFSRQQAQAMVATHNSLSGRAVRLFKNLRCGMGANMLIPVFEGHPDSDPGQWKGGNLLATISQLKADGSGLWGLVTWNAAGLARRASGPLYPSPLWWHESPDSSGHVYPELLESVGLVPSPNIRDSQAWTRNAAPTATPAPDSFESRLCIALGLDVSASESALIERAREVKSKSDPMGEILGRIEATNNETQRAQSELANRLAEIERIKAEISELNTAGDELRTFNERATDGLLVLAQRGGILTPAEVNPWRGKFTANFLQAADDLINKPVAMNVTPLNLHHSRAHIQTASDRRMALQSEVQKRMRETGETYDTAFNNCLLDPKLAPLVTMMNFK